ncbi:FMN-linked oxidoreductase [Dissoconium aciculare CBS 342.82]|uniref:FMN-linked oxidoreductase n=1 Tax=Dissoconium aciculare CBS 342.82 TaxID=1314786 RepID=A0A6J3LV23_9PEZI|nr:FMN-linked oxidoreductase [Dissoconium aciculare CBS 342.82]KAF1819615.1 FMN-linked oxidoreductase [Dissoconium aciculare CBS 342.82]
MLRVMTTTAKRVPIPKNGVDYRGKIVLAPMVRSGECPSRLLALKYGADLVWGPETVDRALIGCTRIENKTTNTIDFTRYSSNGNKDAQPDHGHRESVIFRLHPEREGRRLIHQIGTANPETAVQAAKLIAADVAGIDVNAGCPKPFSTLGGMGAALLKTPEKLCEILRALVKDVGGPFEIGISVKIRLLETPEQTEALVRALCDTGITGLTIHCRTTPMRPRERAIRDQLKMIADICRETGVACLMNGDVYSRDEALGLIAEYGVDGAMIATAAETNPSVFRPESEGGKASWDVVIREYIETSMEVQNRWGNTKFLLGQMIPGKQPVYQKMTGAKSYTELVQVLGHPDLVERAKITDEQLGIGDFEAPKVSKSQQKAAKKAAAKQQHKGKTTRNNGSKVEKQKHAASSPIKPSAQPAGHNSPTIANKKRSAEQAELESLQDMARDRAPGSIPESVSALAI